VGVGNFSYTVTAKHPGLAAVLAAYPVAYYSLKEANLSDPSAEKLAPPLLEMSCYDNPPILTCTRALTRPIKEQNMCILCKNDADVALPVRIDVSFLVKNGTKVAAYIAANEQKDDPLTVLPTPSGLSPWAIGGIAGAAVLVAIAVVAAALVVHRRRANSKGPVQGSPAAVQPVTTSRALPPAPRNPAIDPIAVAAGLTAARNQNAPATAFPPQGTIKNINRGTPVVVHTTAENRNVARESMVAAVVEAANRVTTPTAVRGAPVPVPVVAPHVEYHEHIEEEVVEETVDQHGNVLDVKKHTTILQ
jgi:hypothetical protein